MELDHGLVAAVFVVGVVVATARLEDVAAVGGDLLVHDLLGLDGSVAE